jgi:hypothetical protein
VRVAGAGVGSVAGAGAAVVLLLAACGADRPAGGASASGSAAGDPYAAKSICEAECRRSIRCAHGIDPQSCYARCATLPVRNPPAWRADFTAMVVGCMDHSTCATDDDERCVLLNLASATPNASERACLAFVDPSQRSVWNKRARTCFLYSGVTPGADAWFSGCLQAAAPSARSCEPPLDWK